ncbi:hypothetical protein WKW79_33970 [Variovorax robiniae]|uniref:TerB family tellurite resistance protein n=1 Tax=Variovorax robiniae TaxID=1836199 RepID=A0ABU8XJF0_9BURK
MREKLNASMDGLLDINRPREAAAQLLTMVIDMVADGDLDDLEIEFLRAWLEAHSDIGRTGPGASITRAIEHMLADGHVSDLERTYLMASLQQLSPES